MRTISVRPMIAQPQLPPITACTPSEDLEEHPDQRAERALDDVARGSSAWRGQPRLRPRACGGTGAGRSPDPARRGSAGCTAAAARRRGRVREVCRTRGSPVSHSPSSSARSGSAAERGRDQASGRGGSAPPPASRGEALSRARRLREQVRQRRLDAGEAVGLAELARSRARDDDDVVARRDRVRLARARLAQQALEVVALDRAADLAPDREADPRGLLARRAGTRTARGSGSRPTDPGGRRGRTRRCATDGRCAAARRRRAAARPRSDRQALAALGATPLQRQTAPRASACAHESRAPVARLRFLGW